MKSSCAYLLLLGTALVTLSCAVRVGSVSDYEAMQNKTTIEKSDYEGMQNKTTIVEKKCSNVKCNGNKCNCCNPCESSCNVDAKTESAFKTCCPEVRLLIQASRPVWGQYREDLCRQFYSLEKEPLQITHGRVADAYYTDATTDFLTEIPFVGTIKAAVSSTYSFVDGKINGKDSDKTIMGKRFGRIKKEDKNWYNGVYNKNKLGSLIFAALQNAKRGALKQKDRQTDKKKACSWAQEILDSFSGKVGTGLTLLSIAGVETPGMGVAKGIAKTYFGAQHAWAAKSLRKDNVDDKKKKIPPRNPRDSYEKQCKAWKGEKDFVDFEKEINSNKRFCD